MYGMNNNSGCRSVPQFTSLSLIWKNEIIPHGFSWVLNEFIVWILCICSIIFIRTKQNNNNKTQKCVTSLSDLKCGSRTEIQNKSIPFEMLWSHSFSCLTGLFFHMIRLFIAFDKQAGKFQWIVIATLWSDITYLTFTNIRVCVCKYKYRFMYIYICINMCVIYVYDMGYFSMVWGKWHHCTAFKNLDISRMFMDEYCRREPLLFSPAWVFCDLPGICEALS